MCSVPGPMNTRSNWAGLRRYSDDSSDRQRMAADEEERRVLFGRSHEISRCKTPSSLSKYLAGGRGQVVPAFSRARFGGRNPVDDSACSIGARTPAVRWLPDGGEMEFEERGRLQELLC